jgi:cytochrome b561
MKTITSNRVIPRSNLPGEAYHPGRRTIAKIGGRPPSHLTRVLHLLLLVAVLTQLISSQFIEQPLPGEAPSVIFSLHEYVGLGTFVIVFAFWCWTLIRQGETKFGRLFPWLSPRRVREVVADTLGQLRRLSRGDFSDQSGGAMVSSVHGLGLLVMTGMAVTGSAYFFLSGTLAHTALSLHSLMANLVWAYLIGHSTLAALHHLLGSDILARMFWLPRGVRSTGFPSCEHEKK